MEENFVCKVDFSKKRKPEFDSDSNLGIFDRVEQFTFCPSLWLDNEQEFNDPDSKKPDQPTVMKLSEIERISKFIQSELMELIHSIEPDFEKACVIFDQIGEKAKKDSKLHFDKEPTAITPQEKTNAQADAFVDVVYFVADQAAKSGFPAQKVFDLVHEANMAKAWPDGKMRRRREDAKIQKPSSWKPASTEHLFDFAIEK